MEEQLKKNTSPSTFYPEVYRHKILDGIIRKSPVIAFIWRTSEGWPVEFVSESIRQFGYTPEDFLSGRISYADIIHKDDLDRIKQEVRENLEKGLKEYVQEYRIITKSGDVRYIDDRTYVQENSEQELTHRQGIILDITQRKLAEEQLKKSEENYRVLMDQASDGIFISDEYGNYVDVNRRGCDMLGFSKEELLSMNIRDVMYLEDLRSRPLDLVQLQDGNTRLTEKRLVCKDGSLITVEISATQLADGRLQASVRDITRRKVNENALRESEERFRSAFEEASIGMIMITPEGSFLQANKSFTEMLGYENLEMQNMRYEQVMHPDDVNQLSDALKKMLIGELKSCRLERRFLKKDGSILWAKLSVSLLWNSDSLPLYFIAQIEDISFQKNAERALRESEAKYRFLVENAPLGILLAERGGQILEINSKFLKIFGLSSPQEAKTCTVATLPGLEYSNFAKDFHMCQEGQPYIVSECSFMNKLGRRIELRYHITPVRNAEGKITSLQALIEDITERKDAENKLIDSYKHLAVINRQLAVLAEFEEKRSNTDMHGMFEFILRSSVNLSRARFASFYLYNSQTGIFQRTAFQGGDEGTADELTRLLQDKLEVFSKIKVARKRMQFNAKDFRLEQEPVIRLHELKYFLILPLATDSQLLGMIMLAFSNREVLNTQELDFYSVFSLQSSLILQQVMQGD